MDRLSRPSSLMRGWQDVTWSSVLNAKPSLVLLVGSFLCVLPVLVRGVADGPDLSSHLRFAQAFFESIKQGNAYPAWQHNANSGFGDGSFRVYSPLFYYVLIAVRALTRDWFLSFRLVTWLLAFAGSWSIFYWVRGWGSRTQAILAALIYCFGPFRMNELYGSAMLPEFGGAVWFALLLGFTERLATNQVPHNRLSLVRALVALCSAGLVLTHIPLAMMAVFVIPMYALFRRDRNKGSRKLSDLFLPAILGGALSAFYWMDLLYELPLVKGTMVDSAQRFDFRANLAFSTSSQSPWSWYVNFLFVTTFALVVPGLVLLFGSKRFEIQRHSALLTVLVVGLFTFFMTTPLSSPLWVYVPKLSAMEFPWRWLAASSILASGIAGFSFPILCSRVVAAKAEHENISNAKNQSARQLYSRARLNLLLSSGALLVAFSFAISYPLRNAMFLDRQAFQAVLESSRSSTGLEEWLPRWTTSRTVGEAPQKESRLVAISGRNVSIDSWLSESRQFTVGAGNATVATLRTLYYPYWKFQTKAGLVLSANPDDNGILKIDVPPEVQTIQMRFVRPPHQIVGTCVSLLGALILSSMVFFSVLRKTTPSCS
ncbi:MAG: hypothetical protein C5B55_07675 [Blastocatellia bacterium]|nr:MAG: hypothetical protein C5B55_07675 [Blastocatellia bacterium]